MRLALVGAFSVITNVRMELFEALVNRTNCSCCDLVNAEFAGVESGIHLCILSCNEISPVGIPIPMSDITSQTPEERLFRAACVRVENYHNTLINMTIFIKLSNPCCAPQVKTLLFNGLSCCFSNFMSCKSRTFILYICICILGSGYRSIKQGRC